MGSNGEECGEPGERVERGEHWDLVEPRLRSLPKLPWLPTFPRGRGINC